MTIEKTGCGWTVTVEDIDEALQSADYVCVSISTGGLEAMHKDYTINKFTVPAHKGGVNGNVNKVRRAVSQLFRYD